MSRSPLKMTFSTSGELMVAYSYDTCIFVRSTHGGRCFINRTSYSNTTIKHLAKVRAAISPIDNQLACDAINMGYGVEVEDLIRACLGAKYGNEAADELLFDYQPAWAQAQYDAKTDALWAAIDAEGI